MHLTPTIYSLVHLLVYLCSLSRILKRRSGVGRPSLRESESGVSAKVPREIERTKPRENVFEVLIEGDDGKFISQSKPLLLHMVIVKALQFIVLLVAGMLPPYIDSFVL